MKEFDEEKFFMKLEHEKYTDDCKKIEEREFMFRLKQDYYNKTKSLMCNYDEKIIPIFLGYVSNFTSKVVHNLFIDCIEKEDKELEAKVTHILKNKVKCQNEICKILQNNSG